MMCPYCGAENPDDTEVCSVCQQVILEEDTDIHMTAEHKRNQLIVTYIYIIGTILVLSAAFYALATWANSLSKDRSNRLYRRILKF